MFTCYLGDFESTGGIFATDEHGEHFEEIISEINTDYCIDDMVFDSKGGFISPTLEGIQRILKVASTTFLLILKR